MTVIVHDAHSPGKGGRPVITVEGVTKQYGTTRAVDGVTFTAFAGRVTGFLGPNGAGKSTTMRIVVGLTRPTSGTITISGRTFVDLPNPGLEVGVLLDASAQHAGRPGRRPSPSPSGTWACRGVRVTRCWTWSASPPRRRPAGCATTHSGCVNDSASRTP